MKKIVLLIIIISSFTNYSISQKEGNIWYFGFNAGIDFNGPNPVALTDGMTNCLEAVSSIADSSGNLLFYTDGVTIWDKTHTQMVTGLSGHTSSAQGALIVQQPESNSVFYVFTMGDYNNNTGLKYSIVDMTLNGGNGDATSTLLPLCPSTTEQLTGIHHTNGKDIWIICHEWNSNNFYSYLLTETGVSTTPIITSIGPSIDGTVYGVDTGAGRFTPSPSGNNLIMSGNAIFDYISIFDFDKSNGTLSNFDSINLPNFSYNIEYSASGQYLYAVENDYNGGIVNYVSQYNLLAADIPASRIVLYTHTPTSSATSMYGIKRGPNNKIYLGTGGQTFLSVIHSPDSSGTSCNFQYNDFDLNGRYGTSFPSSIYSKPTKELTINEQNEAFFTLYPNPVSNQLILKTDLEINKVSIFDISGKLMKVTEKISNINVSSLSQGIYFINIRTSDKMIIKKFVKK